MLDGRQKWTLTQEAFDKLLVALGGDRDSAAEKYLEIRTNLVRFFEWRGCLVPRRSRRRNYQPNRQTSRRGRRNTQLLRICDGSRPFATPGNQ